MALTRGLRIAVALMQNCHLLNDDEHRDIAQGTGADMGSSAL